MVRNLSGLASGLAEGLSWRCSLNDLKGCTEGLMELECALARLAEGISSLFQGLFLRLPECPWDKATGHGQIKQSQSEQGASGNGAYDLISESTYVTPALLLD